MTDKRCFTCLVSEGGANCSKTLEVHGGAMMSAGGGVRAKDQLRDGWVKVCPLMPPLQMQPCHVLLCVNIRISYMCT